MEQHFTDTCEFYLALLLILKCYCHYQLQTSENMEKVFSQVCKFIIVRDLKLRFSGEPPETVGPGKSNS